MRVRIAALIGFMVLAGLVVGTPATDVRADPGRPGPAGDSDLAYKIGRGPLSSARGQLKRAADVSVMSFNVCGGVCHRGAVPQVAEFVARTAVAQRASAVLLQELCYGQFLRIRALLGAQGYAATFAVTTRSRGCAVRDPGRREEFGVAVLVRGGFTGRVVKPLPTPAGAEKRVLLGVTAEVGGRPTFVAVVHLAPSAAAGLDGQLSMLAGRLNPRASAPVIVGGDFNSLPDNPGLSGWYSAAVGGSGRFLEADELRTGEPERGGAPTFDTADRKIDYVFFADGWFGSPRATSLATPMSDHHVYLATARTLGE